MRTLSRFKLARSVPYAAMVACFVVPLTLSHGQLTYWYYSRYEEPIATIDIDCQYYAVLDDSWLNTAPIGSSHETIEVYAPPASVAEQKTTEMVLSNVPTVSAAAGGLGGAAAGYLYGAGTLGSTAWEAAGIGMGVGGLVGALVGVGVGAA